MRIIGTIAERNLNFVLQNQNPDGSWFYAVDGVRDFVDHYHTCFVMKALAKIHALTGHEATLKALEKGVDYYLNNLFAGDGLPKPFSKAPRLTVYKREFYDCAECINLCLLLRDRFPQLSEKLATVVRGGLKRLGQTATVRSGRVDCIWAGITSRCIVGGSRRCFARSRFIYAKHLLRRSMASDQRSKLCRPFSVLGSLIPGRRQKPKDRNSER